MEDNDDMPSAKRRRTGVRPRAGSRNAASKALEDAVSMQDGIANDQDDIVPDSDGENEQELPLDASLARAISDEAERSREEGIALHEADTSLPHNEAAGGEGGGEDWDAVLDEVEWDDLLAVDADAEHAAEQIFSPSGSRDRSNRPVLPSSSPLKAGVVEADASQVHLETVGDAMETDSDKEEADRIAADEAALLARYGNLDFLNNFHAQQLQKHNIFPTVTDQNTPSASTSLIGSGFTSLRGKSLAPSEEALAKSSRFGQLSPEAAKTDESASVDDEHALRTAIQVVDTPLLQRTRPGRALGAQTPIAAGDAGRTAGNGSTMPKGNALQPLRYGPKNGHSLLPNRLPSHAMGIGTPVEKGKSSTINSGFTSGSGQSVSMPTKQDAERHMSTLESLGPGDPMASRPADSSSSPPPVDQPFTGLTFASGGAFQMPSKAALDKERGKMDGQTTESDLRGGQGVKPSTANFAGLTSGSGKTVAIPSKDAIAGVIAQLDVSNASPMRAATYHEEDHASTGAGSAFGLTTGSGKAFVQPSADKIAAALANLDKPTGNALPFFPAPTAREQGVFTGLTSGGGKAVAAPSAAAIAAATAKLDGGDTSERPVPHASAPSTPSRQALASKTTNAFQTTSPVHGIKRAGTPAQGNVSLATPGLRKPFKVPIAGRAALNGPPATPGMSSPGGSQAFQHRRLNLEMTPKNTPQSAVNRSTFKTPFKHGVRPDPSTLSKLRKESNDGMVEPGKSVDVVASQTHKPEATPAKAGAKTREATLVKSSVFDIYSKRPRKQMKAYGLDPHVDVDRLIAKNVPKAAIFMTFEQAEPYKFNNEFGYQAAHEDLVYFCGCRGIALDWVRNHWSLIVWKVAAIVRAKPDEAKERWNFQHVINQLKYRYEREIVCGQRSCIKRIQERDSSAWLPMILVVTEILYEDREVPPEPGSDKERMGIVRTESVANGLVLSDGWYRIRTANLDDGLFRAICFRSIYPGMKIRVQGAKIDGGSDGAEPLEAFATSALQISGNSTSRARWDAKLGFQNKPNVCAFSSLLPDGGFVPFIDVVATRVWNIGFRGEYVEGAPADTWNEEEERERQRKWESERLKAMEAVRFEQEKAYRKLQNLLMISQNALRLASSVKKEDVEADESGLGDFSDIFDKMEEDPDKALVIVKRVSKEVLQDLVESIAGKLQAFSTDAQSIDREVEARCPPRVAKPFRVIRVQDYRLPATETSRTCQLNIVDANKLDPDFLVEGKRYMISNLNPTRQSSWTAPNAINGEIFLSTRYDSKWQVLPL